MNGGMKCEWIQGTVWILETPLPGVEGLERGAGRAAARKACWGVVVANPGRDRRKASVECLPGVGHW